MHVKLDGVEMDLRTVHFECRPPYATVLVRPLEIDPQTKLLKEIPITFEHIEIDWRLHRNG